MLRLLGRNRLAIAAAGAVAGVATASQYYAQCKSIELDSSAVAQLTKALSEALSSKITIDLTDAEAAKLRAAISSALSAEKNVAYV